MGLLLLIPSTGHGRLSAVCAVKNAAPEKKKSALKVIKSKLDILPLSV